MSALFPGFRHARVHGWLGELPGGVTTLAAVGQLTGVAGYVCRVRRVRRVAELDATERQRIGDAAAQGRGTTVVRGFSTALGRFGDAADGECVVVTAHRAPDEAAGQDPSGDDLKALLHFVP